MSASQSSLVRLSLGPPLFRAPGGGRFEPRGNARVMIRPSSGGVAKILSVRRAAPPPRRGRRSRASLLSAAPRKIYTVLHRGTGAQPYQRHTDVGAEGLLARKFFSEFSCLNNHTFWTNCKTKLSWWKVLIAPATLRELEVKFQQDSSKTIRFCEGGSLLCLPFWNSAPF